MPILSETGKPLPLSGWTLWAALASLAAFGVFVWFMITQIAAEEITWTRLAWLFASVEAIAFGAAGALFGSTIQRQRAENAEQRADSNQKSAASGQALAKLLIADDQTAGKSEDALRSGVPLDAAALAARHAAFAKGLFPEAQTIP